MNTNLSSSLVSDIANNAVNNVVNTANNNVNDINTLSAAITTLKRALDERKNGDTKIPYFLYIITTTAPGNTLTSLAVGNNDTTEELPHMVPITKSQDNDTINESISKTIENHMSDELKSAYSKLESAPVGGSRKRHRKHKRRHNTKRRYRK
jgi:phosphoketolase